MSDLVKNPYLANEDAGEPLIPTASLQIYDFIADYLKRANDTHVNRASSATLCPKRRWFQRKGYEGKPLTPRKMINFLFGDLSEKTLNYFVSKGCVGPGKLYSEVQFGKVIGTFWFSGKEIEVYQQEELLADIDGIPVTAHVDGWGKRNLDGKWELIEFKSASNYGFADFKKSGAGDYLRQAMVNLQTNKAKELGATEVRFWFLRKETGHIYDQLEKFDPAIAADVARDYRISNQADEPETPYPPVDAKGGRKTLDWRCQYCPYSGRCHKFTQEWKSDQWGNQKPVYVVE